MSYIDRLTSGLSGPVTVAKGTFLITLHKSGPPLVIGGGLNPCPYHMAATQEEKGKIREEVKLLDGHFPINF